MEQESPEAYVFKNRRTQVRSHSVTIAVRGWGLASRRPERLPGSRRRVEDDLEKRVQLEWISKVQWRKFWTGS